MLFILLRALYKPFLLKRIRKGEYIMKTIIAAGKFCKRRENEAKNKLLAQEFNEYACNIFATNLLLEQFETTQELKRTGLLLKPEEAKRRAQKTSEKMIDCNLIQNGLLVPGMLEYIQEVTA